MDSFYSPMSARSKAAYMTALTVDINVFHPFANSTVEVRNNVHQYNNHPVSQTIGHWVPTRGGARDRLVRGRLVVVTVAVTLVAVTGCTGRPRAASTPPSITTSTPTPSRAMQTATPKPWPIESATWKALWGATTPRVTRVVSVRDSRPASSHLIDPRQSVSGEGGRTAILRIQGYLDDGTTGVAIWADKPPPETPELGLRPGDNSIGMVVNGAYRAFVPAGRDAAGPFKGLLRQITNVAMNHGDLVWVETPSTDLDGNEWTIRAWRQSTGRVTEVAHSRYLRAGHRYAGYAGSVTPVALNGKAFWPTPVPTSDHPGDNDPRDWAFQILSAPLSGDGPVRSVATGAAFAAVTDGSLFYATHSMRAGQHVGYVIHRRVGGFGRDTVVASGKIGGTADLTNLAAGNGMLAWTVSSPDEPREWRPRKTTPGRAYLLDLASRALVQIVTAGDAQGNYSLAFGPGRFLWGNGSGAGDGGQYVYNLADHAIYRLGVSSGGSVVVSAPTGQTIRWWKNCPTDGHPMLGCDVTAGWRP